MKLIFVLSLLVLTFSTIEVFSAENAPRFLDSESERVILITKVGEESDLAKSAVNELDAENSGILISISDTEDKDALADRLAEYLGVSMSSAPHLFFYDTNNNKYLFSGEYTLAGLKEFFENARNKAVKSHIKSAEIPTYTDDDVFQVIVGNNWVEEVLESDKESFAYIYAPWCGHCQHFAPVFEKLAKQFASNKNVKFVKIDATANDLPQFPAVQGFPTIAYITKGDNPFVMYEGDRSESDIVRFIKENTKFDWVELGETTAGEDGDL